MTSKWATGDFQDEDMRRAWKHAQQVVTGIDHHTTCHWCAHEPHDEACTRTIQTGGSKTPVTIDCPCRKHERTKEPK